ncbi:helix-turn-helix domain-containing protein [bacterium]|nr:helix-turn-helix domain-containing protein [bacterium]
MTFGQALRLKRRSKGVTQRELASKVGVDFSYISKLENDRLPPPSAGTIENIAEALDVAPEELLALTGKVPSAVQGTLGTSSEAISFLQEAVDMNLSDFEWQRLRSHLKELRG